MQRLSRITREGRVANCYQKDGSVRDVFSSELRDEVYVFGGWLEPPAIWHGNSDVQRIDLDDKPPFDLAPYVTERRFARVRDGTQVPYTIIARRGWRANLSNPVLATAYGAYQFSWTPRFEPRLFAFLDAGGIFVVANVRGGGASTGVSGTRPAKRSPNPTPGATSSTFPRR